MTRFYLSYGIICIYKIVITKNIMHHLNVVTINFFVVINIEKNPIECIITMRSPFNYLNMLF